MFQKWLSGFYRKNKNKIKLLAKVAFISFIATFIFYLAIKNTLNGNSKRTNIDESQTIYKPQQTVISGSNIKEEIYQEDESVVKEFVDYCNNGKINEAYNLLTDECKENLYQTVEDFKIKYCDRYFSNKKEYSLQSWINNENYKTYQMRITEDILSSGEYKDGNAYQDYITIVGNGENAKININSFIGRQEIGRVSNIEEISIYVKKVDIYMDYEEYTLEVTNNTENVIILDNMKDSSYSLRLEMSNGNTYPVILNSINYIKLIVNPQETKDVKIQFSNSYSSGLSGEYILFSKIVRNYNEYINNQDQYNDFITMKATIN